MPVGILEHLVLGQFAKLKTWLLNESSDGEGAIRVDVGRCKGQMRNGIESLKSKLSPTPSKTCSFAPYAC